MYEEDIGKMDWAIRSIGPLKFSFFDQAHTSRRVIIASELSILASVTQRSGEMVWRRSLEEYRPIDTLLHRESTLITVSDNGKVMRKWDPNTGHLDWEVSTEGDYETEDSYVQAFLNEKNNVLLLTSSKLKHYTIGGHLLSDTDLGQEVEECSVFMISALKSSIVILCYKEEVAEIGWMRLQNLKVQEKGVVKTHSKFLKDDCIIVQMSRIVCMDRVDAKFHISPIGEGAEFEIYSVQDLWMSPKDLTQDSCITASEHFSKSSPRFFFKLSTSSHYILELDPTAKSVKSIQFFSSSHPLLLFDEALENNIIVFSLTSNTSYIQVQCYDVTARTFLESLELTLPLDQFSGYPVKSVPFLFQKKGQTLGYRLIVSFQDGSVSLIQQTGRTSWTRDEAISEIVSAKLISLDSAQESASYSSVLLDSAVSSNPVEGFFKMIYSQVMYLKDAAFLFKRTLFDTSSINITFMSSSPRPVHSSLILVTRLGKVYSVDSTSGNIIWKQYIPHFTSYLSSLFEEKFIITLIDTSQALLAVLGPSKRISPCNGTVSVIFDLVTGEILERAPSCLPYNITQVVELGEDKNKMSGLAILDSDDRIHIFPPEYALDSEFKAFMYTADSQRGRICGHLFSNDAKNGVQHTPTWTFMLPPVREELVHFSVKNAKESIYANARVLPDRSVLYKYLNPHLLAFVTESKNERKPYVNVYVMDGVSGRLIHQSHHANARSTVPPILTENWLAYQIVNLKEKRQELVILEMYEGKALGSAKSWTSFSNINVRFLSQSFILPGDLYSMTVTNSHRGITPKDIILGFGNGQLFSLPKSLVEPRIPPELSSGTPQPPVKPPSPRIPIFYPRVINYNRSMDRLREIIVVPAELESTCSVLAYGLDVFLALSSPSKPFDTLAGDFGYAFIIGVMALFLLASLIGSRVAIYRSTSQSWS